jgi:hypothetical protein
MRGGVKSVWVFVGVGFVRDEPEASQSPQSPQKTKMTGNIIITIGCRMETVLPAGSHN